MLKKSLQELQPLACKIGRTFSQQATTISSGIFKQTTLPNGFRICTETLPVRGANTAAVGLFINVGSRYENDHNNGVAHYLEHINFKGTPKRHARDIEVEFENSGSKLNANTSREQTVFISRCLRSDLTRTVDCLQDILLNSLVTERAVASERGTILREMEDVEQSISEVMFDLMHQGAYGNCPLGYTILGPEKNIRTMTREQLLNFRSTHYTPQRMALVSVGNVTHDEMVALGEQYFTYLSRESSITSANATPKPAVYSGADIRRPEDQFPIGHIQIAFEGPSLCSSDYIPGLLLQTMLGSWDRNAVVSKHISSSMCRRLAVEDAVYSVSTTYHPYTDSGLLGMYFTAEPANQEKAVRIIMEEAVRKCFEISDEELVRAKNNLKTWLLSMQFERSLDSRCEEFGRQILYYQRRIPEDELFARIDAVDVDTVRRVAAECFYDKDPVVVAIGPIDNLPSYDEIRAMTYITA